MAIEPKEYLTLLQAAAVTVVACVLIVNASGDIYLSELTGEREPGNGPLAMRIKYVGTMARICRWMIAIVGAMLTAAYTSVFSAVAISIIIDHTFTPQSLTNIFIGLVSTTIVAVCWIALLCTVLRWRHMRDCVSPAQYFWEL
jgi:uncharacterized BrkB/YihY/UPF0761 family membrane protein